MCYTIKQTLVYFKQKLILLTKNMKIKSKIFIAIALFLSFLLILIPYYSLFSFEKEKNILNEQKIEKQDKIEKKMTNYSLEEIENIEKILEKIDEKKILDSDLKNNLDFLKNSFKNEKKNILEEEKLKENLQKIFEKKYEKKLDITKKMAKLHIQERNQSCEAAATADILSTILKKDFSEAEILEKMPKEKTYWKPSYEKNWKIIWWDPNVGFVGDMDGKQYNLTGYAIYEKPMSKIYKDLGLKFETYNKFENNLWLKSTKEALVYLLKQVHDWNFVQSWGDYCTDQNFEDGKSDEKISTKQANDWFSQKNFCYSFNQERRVTWFTEEWKEIRAPKQSHNFVILGYIWDIENPEKIIVWDTQTWKHIYPTSEWMRKWELNDARAIIIYNKKN